MLNKNKISNKIFYNNYYFKNKNIDYLSFILIIFCILEFLSLDYKNYLGSFDVLHEGAFLTAQLNFLNKDKFLEGEIRKLNGKKIIFTNGSRAHAENVTKRIGIDKLFDGIFDIRDSEFIPKPSREPYIKLVENYKIEPQYCIFFEDIARNLKPAHELGMKTVWIKNNEPWASKFSDAEFINYKTDKLANFLKEINEFKWIRKNN